RDLSAIQRRQFRAICVLPSLVPARPPAPVALSLALGRSSQTDLRRDRSCLFRGRLECFRAESMWEELAFCRCNATSQDRSSARRLHDPSPRWSTRITSFYVPISVRTLECFPRRAVLRQKWSRLLPHALCARASTERPN